MKEKLLKKLLRETKEQDWFDFKGKLKLYQSDGKLVDQQRDELLKDVLGLANGNSHIIRKTKYLIIGADDQKFEENGQRVLYDVDYKVPSRSDLTKWLSSVCTPSISGLECELVSFQGINLFIITIPPTFNLHETTRDLIAANARFNKHTVFMRQDEHTVPASVRDGMTIQQLKHLHRQEIANPPSILIGAIAGGVVAFIIGGTKITSSEASLAELKNLGKMIFTVLGIFFGGFVGWVGKQLNETRYDLRYMTWRQRILLASLIVFIIVVSAIFNR